MHPSPKMPPTEGATVVEATREAVAAALRGASDNQPRPEKPPAYGKMNDAEWAQELKRLGLG
jgi:hypothetical protein